MITPEIHSIGSVDIIGPLETWQPKDTAFYVDLDIFIGPAGTEVEERFTLYVCSPAWLEQYVEDRGPLDGRHTYIVTGVRLSPRPGVDRLRDRRQHRCGLE